MSLMKSLMLLLAGAMISAVLVQPMVAQSDSKEVKPLAEGDQATDFELQSIGKKIKLSDNFKDGGKPVVVVFSRANW